MKTKTHTQNNKSFNSWLILKQFILLIVFYTINDCVRLFYLGLDYSDMQDITSQVAGKGDVARKAKFLLSLLAKYQESFNAVENVSSESNNFNSIF